MEYGKHPKSPNGSSDSEATIIDGNETPCLMCASFRTVTDEVLQFRCENAKMRHDNFWQIMLFVEEFFTTYLDHKGYFWEPPIQLGGNSNYNSLDFWEALISLGQENAESFLRCFRMSQCKIFEGFVPFQTYLYSFASTIFKKDFDWGKLALFFAFCGELSYFCFCASKDEFIQIISHLLSQYIIVHVFDDFCKNGGWAGFEFFCYNLNRTFKKKDLENRKTKVCEESANGSSVAEKEMSQSKTEPPSSNGEEKKPDINGN